MSSSHFELLADRREDQEAKKCREGNARGIGPREHNRRQHYRCAKDCNRGTDGPVCNEIPASDTTPKQDASRQKGRSAKADQWSDLLQRLRCLTDFIDQEACRKQRGES